MAALFCYLLLFMWEPWKCDPLTASSINPKEISRLNLFPVHTQISLLCCQHLHHISNSWKFSWVYPPPNSEKEKQQGTFACLPLFEEKGLGGTLINHSLESNESREILGKAVIRWVDVQETDGRILKIRVISMTEFPHSRYMQILQGMLKTSNSEKNTECSYKKSLWNWPDFSFIYINSNFFQMLNENLVIRHHKLPMDNFFRKYAFCERRVWFDLEL